MRKRRNTPIKITKDIREKRKTPILPISYGSKRKISPTHAHNVRNVKKRIPKRYEESDIFFQLRINQTKCLLLYSTLSDEKEQPSYKTFFALFSSIYHNFSVKGKKNTSRICEVFSFAMLLKRTCLFRY